MAKALDIASQQIFKYENGIDRIPASRLYEFSKLLAVQFSFFFDESTVDTKELVVTCAKFKRQKSSFDISALKGCPNQYPNQEDYEIEIL